MNKSTDFCIYVAYHKESERLTNDPIYQPIHVGKALSNINLGFPGDNTGDNISFKNKTFCETTALYWIWKNTSHTIVGLAHYRRYLRNNEPSLFFKLLKKAFYLIGMGNKRHGISYVRNFAQGQKKILTGQHVQKLMQSYDVILPQERILKRSIMVQYAIRRPKNDLLTVREIIKEQTPEYLDTFDRIMKGKKIYACNMFVMKKKIFDQYMEWLFNILFELEKRVDITGYSLYHQRIYGFIAERLLKVWISTNQEIKIKELPTLYFKRLF